MARTTNTEREAREASRNIGQEILDGIREIKAGKGTRREFTAASFWILRAREKSGLSQSQFAALLGVSKRTLEQWEQGRREPSRAAKMLIRVAEQSTSKSCRSSRRRRPWLQLFPL